MKILALRKKIIINFFASLVIVLIIAAIFFYQSSEEANLQLKISKLQSETSEVKAKTADFRDKTVEIKKYKTIWDGLDENRKSTKGIKMDSINEILQSLGNKYDIFNPKIKVTLPETLTDNIFSRNTVDVLLANVTLDFSALNDIKALGFVTEFIDSIPGYAIVTNLEIKKEKKYTDQDFIDITSGKAFGSISGRLDLFLYTYKDKEIGIKVESTLGAESSISPNKTN